MQRLLAAVTIAAAAIGPCLVAAAPRTTDVLTARIGSRLATHGSGTGAAAAANRHLIEAANAVARAKNEQGEGDMLH